MQIFKDIAKVLIGGRWLKQFQMEQLYNHFKVEKYTQNIFHIKICNILQIQDRNVAVEGLQLFKNTLIQSAKEV